jgi:hypothetical protein
MRAIDTNVLGTLLFATITQLDVAEKFIVKGAWVSHVVLIKLWVLDASGRSAEQIGTAVERLLAHADLTGCRRYRGPLDNSRQTNAWVFRLPCAGSRT